MEKKVILYLGYWSRELRRRRFDGILRYAGSRGWNVVPVPSNEVPDLPSLRAALARFRPVGVVAECAGSAPSFPPRAFGGVPVVYYDPLERAGWRDAVSVACDEAAVADEDGAYRDALLLEFGERGYKSYSAYSLFEGKGAGDDFAWSEPAPAGELESLL